MCVLCVHHFPAVLRHFHLWRPQLRHVRQCTGARAAKGAFFCACIQCRCHFRRTLVKPTHASKQKKKRVHSPQKRSKREAEKKVLTAVYAALQNGQERTWMRASLRACCVRLNHNTTHRSAKEKKGNMRISSRGKGSAKTRGRGSGTETTEVMVVVRPHSRTLFTVLVTFSFPCCINQVAPTAM